jgi:hypothetical protein
MFAQVVEFLRSIIEWIRQNYQDYLPILYKVGSAVLIAFFGRVIALIVWGRDKTRLTKAEKQYYEAVKKDCNTTTIVGRKVGFSLQEVYVELNAAQSDLMASPGKRQLSSGLPDASLVLLGGPGAGKSTVLKKAIIDWIDCLPRRRIIWRRSNKIVGFAAFVRLRDYTGFESIEAFIASKLKRAGINDPQNYLNGKLEAGGCFIVLDGLDEVRPSQRQKVHEEINSFYSKWFRPPYGNRIIVSCRKEAYRRIPLDLPEIWEVSPLTDDQIKLFVEKWPLEFPSGKSTETFWRDLSVTPKVLELARSPLLLVGGLMQYTESNAGIPEERVEYLRRIERWLIVEWATAQGHPPDPDKKVYDRILPKLAFHIHQDQLSEIDEDYAYKTIAPWLPAFGYKPEEAERLINGLCERTGILIHEGGGKIVFAQFSLQEYFASIELGEARKLEEIAGLSHDAWWREAILLLAGQQRDPAPLLTALFNENPLLAVAAVAECPTPPTVLQEKAIEVCITAVDKADKAATGALVPLLRKVEGGAQKLLCERLEERLTGNNDVASIVGVALAVAGTDAATATLAKKPEVWEQCLSQTGYFSGSFDSLLQNWIAKGSDVQANIAIGILGERAFPENLPPIITILRALPAERANILASFLIALTLKNARRKNYRRTAVYGFFATCSYYVTEIAEALKVVYNTWRESNVRPNEVNIISYYKMAHVTIRLRAQSINSITYKLFVTLLYLGILFPMMMEPLLMALCLALTPHIMQSNELYLSVCCAISVIVCIIAMFATPEVHTASLLINPDWRNRLRCSELTGSATKFMSIAVALILLTNLVGLFYGIGLGMKILPSAADQIWRWSLLIANTISIIVFAVAFIFGLVRWVDRPEEQISIRIDESSSPVLKTAVIISFLVGGLGTGVAAMWCIWLIFSIINSVWLGSWILSEVLVVLKWAMLSMALFFLLLFSDGWRRLHNASTEAVRALTDKQSNL